MVALPADGELRPLDVTHSGLEHFIGSAMINGQLHIYFRDGKVAHHAVSGDVEDIPIFRILVLLTAFAEHVGTHGLIDSDTVIISFRPFPFPVEIFRIGIFRYVFIITDQSALPVSIPLIGNGWIRQDPEPDQK